MSGSEEFCCRRLTRVCSHLLDSTRTMFVVISPYLDMEAVT